MIKQTLTQWYSQGKITLAQTQLLSEIVDSNTAYTLEELNLLAQLPSTPGLTKHQEQSTKWQLESYWKTNRYWLIPLLLLLLLLLLK